MKLGDSPLVLCAPVHAAAPRRVEKTSNASRLHKDSGREPARAPSHCTRDARMAPSRIETRHAAQTQRSDLHAGFVAQVLGQILGQTGGNALVAARAYERCSAGARDRRLIRIL